MKTGHPENPAHLPLSHAVPRDAANCRTRQGDTHNAAGGHTSDEVCALVTGHPVVVSGMDNDAEVRAAGRGVRYRVVVERAVLDRPDGMTGLTAALGRDERVRVVDRVPTKLVVADRTPAMVPLTSHTAEPAALVVHAGGLLELLSGLFESVWRDALPLRLGAHGVCGEQPDGPDGADLEVLSLLLAGHACERGWVARGDP